MKTGTILLIVFMGLLFAVGIGLLGYALWTAWRSLAAAHWQVAPGTITSCELAEHSDGEGGRTYQVKVEYKYSVGGQEFTGDRLAFGYAGSSGHDAHQQILHRLKNAQVVDVRYDPLDPATSTLSFGIHRSIQFMFVFAGTWLAFMVGFATLFWLFSRSDNVLLQNLVTH